MSKESYESRRRELAKGMVSDKPEKYLLPAMLNHYAEVVSTNIKDIGTKDEIISLINKNAQDLAMKSPSFPTDNTMPEEQ
jgi:hypothetical protein